MPMKSRSSITTEKKLAPIHPGEILREELMVPLKLSGNQVALALRVPATRVMEIVHEKRAISPDTALRLARYFKTTAEFWLGLQADYDLQLARDAEEAEIERDVHPLATVGRKLS